MSLVRAERIGPITPGSRERKMATNLVSDSTFSSKVTSASDSDHCGRAAVVVVAGGDVVVVVAGSVVAGVVVVRTGVVASAAVVSGSVARVVVPAESLDPLAHAVDAAATTPAAIRRRVAPPRVS